jgi:hypothetical protein
MVKHSRSGTPEYIAWVAMIQRCTNQKHPSWKNYGARGIRVCDRWKGSFMHFLEDVGERPSKSLSLDRIDNNSDYVPENVRWADRRTQRINSRGRSWVDKVLIKCFVCSKEISSYPIRKRKYCSNKCAIIAISNPIKIYCKTCDGLIKSPKGKQTIFCNRKCFAEHRVKKKHSVCGFCKNKFIHTNRGNKIRKFCSAECKCMSKRKRVTYTCLKCQKEVIGHPCKQRKFCSRTCRQTY